MDDLKTGDIIIEGRKKTQEIDSITAEILERGTMSFEDANKLIENGKQLLALYEKLPTSIKKYREISQLKKEEKW